MQAFVIRYNSFIHPRVESLQLDDDDDAGATSTYLGKFSLHLLKSEEV